MQQKSVARVQEIPGEDWKVKPLTDSRAIKVLRKIDREIAQGKRKVVSEAEFRAKFKHLFE